MGTAKRKTARMISPTLAEKASALESLLASYGSALVAFSGGVDSTYLLAVARDVLGEKAVAATVSTVLHMRDEEEEARRLAVRLGAEHLVLSADPLADQALRANRPDRCYVCKRHLMGELLAVARERGLAVVVEGSNADDPGDYRPGMRAVSELGIRSPLLEVGLTKSQIRELARARDLPNWGLPARACLASRIPYGEPLSTDRLERIDRAEAALRALGAVQVRVRDHQSVARIEVPPEEIGSWSDPGMRQRVVDAIKGAGYAYVAIDLEGYRTGSLNDIIGPGRDAAGAAATGTARPGRLAPGESARSVRRPVVRVRRGDAEDTQDAVACEAPLEIRLGDRPWMVVMRTPGEDVALAAGLLLSEGMQSMVSDLRSARLEQSAGGDRLLIDLREAEPATAPPPGPTPARWSTSSSGLAGRRSLAEIERDVGVLPVSSREVRLSAGLLTEALNRMTERQSLFAATGGAHAVALFDEDGDWLAIAEDVGRHNAMDKAVGRALLDGRLGRTVLLVASSRASFEMVQKAAAAQIPVMATVSAPTDLALRVADRAGITLVGFLREGRFNLYTHRDRIRVGERP